MTIFDSYDCSGKELSGVKEYSVKDEIIHRLLGSHCLVGRILYYSLVHRNTGAFEPTYLANEEVV